MKTKPIMVTTTEITVTIATMVIITAMAVTTVIMVIITVTVVTTVIMVTTTSRENLIQGYSDMNTNQYNCLAQEFGPARWVPQHVFGFPQEGWFLLETTPCPPAGEIDMVVSDIVKNEFIHISNGRLSHSKKCILKNHKLNPILQQAASNVKEETFLVAVYPGYGLMNNQPAVIVISPTITYEKYPDHPHLNIGGFAIKNNRPIFYFPDSVCYGYNEQEYGSDEEERLRRTFAQVTIWLFRHQIWVETRKIESPGIWIGPHTGTISPEYFTNKLNPFGECRCGSHKRYADCHMPSDYTKSNKCTMQDAERLIKSNTLYFVDLWKKSVSLPQQYSISILSSALI